MLKEIDLWGSVEARSWGMSLPFVGNDRNIDLTVEGMKWYEFQKFAFHAGSVAGSPAAAKRPLEPICGLRRWGRFGAKEIKQCGDSLNCLSKLVDFLGHHVQRTMMYIDSDITMVQCMHQVDLHWAWTRSVAACGSTLQSGTLEYFGIILDACSIL